MQEREDGLVQEEAETEEDGHALRDDDGAPEPLAISAGRTPVVGDDEQQEGGHDDEQHAHEAVQHVEVGPVLRQVGQGLEIAEPDAEQQRQGHEQRRHQEDRHPLALQLARAHHLDRIEDVQGDDIYADDHEIRLQQRMGEIMGADQGMRKIDRAKAPDGEGADGKE